MMVLTWFLSPLGRKVGIGILIILAIGGYTLWVKHGAREEGREETRQEVTQAAAQNVRADAQNVAQGSQARQQQVQALAGQATISKAQADALVGQVSALRQEIAQSRARVQQMDSGAIHAYVVEQLALRSKGDTSPGYTEPEEKEIAVRVTAYPILQEQTAKQGESIDKLNRALGSKEKEALLLAEDAKDWKDAHGRLLRNYATLYNTYPHKVRSWKCIHTLWFSKCVNKKLTVPAPAEIPASRP
jgi:hypothetical protein